MIPAIRPVKTSDLPALLTFAQKVGYGLTSMPPDEKLLAKKIETSLNAFQSAENPPESALYLFILELQGKPIGTSALLSHIGEEQPFFAFHLRHEKQKSDYLGLDRTIPVLHFIRARKKPTEIASLYLDGTYRRKAYGKLLSFSRFLFMAAFRKRFASLVISELRGFTDKQGRSPFWEAIGKPFFGLEFQEANELRFSHAHVLGEIFPKHPIYPMLLPQPAQVVMGEAHPETLPALKLLRQQNFQFSDYIDLFDGGPHLYAHTDQIAAVKNSTVASVQEIRTEALASEEVFLSNERIDFRACHGVIEQKREGEVILHREVAQALQVEVGDPVRIYSS